MNRVNGFFSGGGSAAWREPRDQVEAGGKEPGEQAGAPKQCPRCSVPGCTQAASVVVMLYDVYPDCEGVFFRRDFTCPYLCGRHMVENEAQSCGVRRPRGCVRYPYTNRHSAQGFTIYRPLRG